MSFRWDGAGSPNCGTGALAIEALSRGAARATLVDRDTRAALGNVERLGLSDNTVKFHVQHLFSKRGVKNRTEAALKYAHGR